MAKKRDNWFNYQFNKTREYIKDAKTDYKKGFNILIIISIIMVFLICVYPFYMGTFYNCNSDDIVQYYPFVAGFFERIKTNTLSIYDTTLFGGASFFASTYYIPIDIFLLIAFILSFIMSIERAYFISILLKIICGGYLMYYVLARKKIKPYAAILISLAYIATGLLQSYIIFPVYLGINVYVPIAMILVSYFFDENKKYYAYYLIPVFVVVLVVFDFYCAYMILAFMSFYFLMESHLLSKSNLFFIKKKFWSNFLTFFSFVILGVLLSVAFLLPSAFYILNESSRSGSTPDYFWYYSTDCITKSGISWKHYFTQLINFYIPNNPARLCLVPAGAYVREHASLYMTCGVLIYLVKFLFMRGKENNQMKFWVLFFNLIYLIPLAAMIFTFTKQGYLRWFFIPYTFNMLASAKAMSDTDFKLSESKISNVFAILSIVFGLALVLFTYISNTTLFIHYSKGEEGEYFFEGILIPSIVFLSIYLIILLIPFISRYFKKNLDLLYKSIPCLILAELIFSIVVVVISLGSTAYSYEYKTSNSQIKYLRNNSDYNFSDGYRINLYTDQKCIANNNTMFLGVNCTNFFQSFYNTQLDTYMKDINMVSNLGWSRRSMYGYSLLNAPMYNNKYVITNDYVLTSDFTGQKEAVRPVVLPEKYYKKYGTANRANYYGLTSLPQFIVYDSVMYNNQSSIANQTTFHNDLSLLNHGYVKVPNQIFMSKSKLSVEELMNDYDNYYSDLSTKEDKEALANIKLLYDNGIKFVTKQESYDEINKLRNISFKELRLSGGKIDAASLYFKYDLTQYSDLSVFTDYDAVYAYPYDSDIPSTDPWPSRYLMYLGTDEKDQNDNYQLYPFHYNVGYVSEMLNLAGNERITPTRFYMKANGRLDSSYVRLFGFNYDIYDDFIESQKVYTNRYFKINGNEITLKFKNDGDSKVIKTSYAYSKDWHIRNNDKDYNIVNLGGFLGIVVPKNIETVNLNLIYSPQGLTNGLYISQIGSIIYLSITSVILLFETKKKIKGKDGVDLCKIYH